MCLLHEGPTYPKCTPPSSSSTPPSCSAARRRRQPPQRPGQPLGQAEAAALPSLSHLADAPHQCLRCHDIRNSQKPRDNTGYTYLHTAIDGFSRLAYTEALDDEKASTTIGFFCRARAFFATHGITRLVRVVTDNGANYRARTFTATITSLASRHQRTRPYTPRHNGKVERYNRILAEECLYARSYSSEQQRRDAVAVWNHHYNYHRPHTACHSQPPATRVPVHVTNVMTSYT